jgi:hypothetical protein
VELALFCKPIPASESFYTADRSSRFTALSDHKTAVGVSVRQTHSSVLIVRKLSNDKSFVRVLLSVAGRWRDLPRTYRLHTAERIIISGHTLYQLTNMT